MACKKCSGKGFISSPVDNGICWICDGTGNEILAKKQKEINKNKKEIAYKQELKELIATCYLSVIETKLKSRKETARTQAKEYFNTLKVKFNYVMTLDEIKLIAEKINKKPFRRKIK